MFFRVIIVTFLLCITTFILIKETEPSLQTALAPVHSIIALAYLFSFVCLFIPKIIKNIKLNIYIQSLSDLSLITGLIYTTGGIESIYSVFYPLVIIYSVLFLAGRGGLIAASVSSIFYGLLLDLEYYGLIQSIYTLDYDYNYEAGYVFSRIFIHIISFYIIALLTSFAVKQEKMARDLLSEKESAFDQLDLLHKSIIESVDTGILTVNLHGNIKSFNKGAEKIAGFLRSKIINQKIDDVLPVLANMLNKENLWKQGGRFEATDSEKILGCSVSPLVPIYIGLIAQVLDYFDIFTPFRTKAKSFEKIIYNDFNVNIIPLRLFWPGQKKEVFNKVFKPVLSSQNDLHELSICFVQI